MSKKTDTSHNRFMAYAIDPNDDNNNYCMYDGDSRSDAEKACHDHLQSYPHKKAALYEREAIFSAKVVVNDDRPTVGPPPSGG